MTEIAVIGAGAWGTALSIVAARRGNHRVRLWAYEAEVHESITKRRENAQFLPGQPIPEKVDVTGDFAEALTNAGIVISVMPSNHCRRLFEGMLPYLRPEMLFVSATKGLEEDSLLRMTEVISQVSEQRGISSKARCTERPLVRKGSRPRRSLPRSPSRPPTWTLLIRFSRN